MPQLLKRAFVPGLIVALSAGISYAETMYAKKSGVNVTAEKSPMSEVVATLDRGDPVEVIEKSGRHYKVSLASGGTGWVFKFKLSERQVGGDGGRGDTLFLLTGKSTIAAREARSGGSIRGLKEVSEAYTRNKKIHPSHKASVEKMEALTIPQDELIRFQREGSIGEFAGGG